MEKTIKLTFSFLLFFILPAGLVGCQGLKKPQQRTIDYYTLEYAPPVQETRESLPVVLRIEPFQVTPLYNSNRIIYREGPYKRSAYNYHKWRANPGDLVTDFLRRDIRTSGLFRGVFSSDSRLASTHIIEGTVEEFFEEDDDDQWSAVLAVSVTLVAEGKTDISRRVIFQRTYRQRTHCEQKSPVGLAESMSKGMAEVSRKVIRDIHQNLSIDFYQNS